MLNFHYRNPARIFFGDGAENNMYDLLKEYKVTDGLYKKIKYFTTDYSLKNVESIYTLKLIIDIVE